MKKLLIFLIAFSFLAFTGIAYGAGEDVGGVKKEGTIDTSGTPAANDFAKFTDANTIEGRSYAQVLSDLSLDANLKDLTAAEIGQLENIGTSTLSAAQWTGLGGATTYGISLWSVADEAAFKLLVNLEAGTDFYSISAADTAFEAELNNSAGLLAALSDESGTGVAIFSNNPRFVGDFGIGSAILVEADIAIIDGAAAGGLTHTELMYLKDFTGTSGTGAICGNISPQLTTPDLGAATYTSLTGAASATPGFIPRDTGCLGSDKTAGKLYWNATTGTDGAEDSEVHLQVMDSGSLKSVIAADGDTTAEYVQVGATDSTYNMHIYNSIPTADGTWSGKAVIRTVKTGQTSVFGQVLHVDTDGELIVADADVASAGAAPGIYMALEAGTGAKLVLEQGYIFETDWNWTPGAIIYLDDDPTENEGLTAVAGIPATAGDQVQVLGVAISADVIKFNPSLVLVEVP